MFCLQEGCQTYLCSVYMNSEDSNSQFSPIGFTCWATVPGTSILTNIFGDVDASWVLKPHPELKGKLESRNP